MKKIIITGITSLLGRNLLFSLNEQYDDLKLFLFGRSLGNESFKERVLKIINEECPAHLIPKKHELLSLFQNLHKVVYIDFSLSEEDFGISKEIRSELLRENIDTFLHIASLTDFRTSTGVIKQLERINVYATKNLLKFSKYLGINNFSYVSSAYVCGSKSGLINPNYINIDEEFRNPYEKSKLQAEIYVRKYCEENSMKYKIFRPSTLCGRLIDEEYGLTYKFDVFYSWAAYFLYLKNNIQTVGINGDVEIPIRVEYSLHSGLNIVPADYAAKLMSILIFNSEYNESYHLVNDEETPHDLYINIMLNMLGIEGVTHTNSIPINQTKIEKMYYRTVGKIFTPYITQRPMNFDKNNTMSSEISCPRVDAVTFPLLMKYALLKNFGIA